MEELPLHLLSGAHRLGAWSEVGVTRAHLHSGLGRREHRGRYAWTATDEDDACQRALVAVSLLPAKSVAALGGWAAGRLLGVEWLDGTTPGGEPLPPLLCLQAPGRIRRPGVRVLRSRLDDGDVVELDGGAHVTSPLRTAFDLARTAPSLAEAVVCLDAMARHGVQPGDVAGYAAARRRWRGVRRVRDAAAMASDRTRSPAESRWRMVWVLDARLPPPLVNATVLGERDYVLGEVDLLDATTGLVSEYDGAPHSDAAARGRDTRKQEQLEDAGLTVVRASSTDLRSTATGVRRLLNGHERARARRRLPWRAVERPLPHLPLAPFTEWSFPSRRAGVP
jgi:very-short-patch-repair endonuclease